SHGGSIINISSVASTSAPATTVVYSATKGAVDSATRALANELGPKKIRVNAVNPGVVITEGVKDAVYRGVELRKRGEAHAAVGRVGVRQDIAPAVVFLASEESSWISGETLHITGGYR